MNSFESVYEQALSLIEQSGALDVNTLSWLRQSSLYDLDRGKAILTYRSIITYNILQEHSGLIQEALEQIERMPVEISLLSEKDAKALMPARNPNPDNPLLNYAFNEAYTFENFVEGSSNQEAYAACMALTTNNTLPGFNPLMLYGNSGLGKTHLLHAVGNELKKNHPDKKVIYMYAGDFVTLLIEAMKNKNPHGNTVERVKEQLLDCDYFLIDDIQNLQHASSQEIFFTIYNKLVLSNAKIILTSDLHPSELSGMQQRLVSRFRSGLAINISRPGFETAKAILKKKIEGQESVLDIDDDVLDFLSLRFSNDVRNLEGSLNRLIFNATLFNPERISLDFANQVLSSDASFAVEQKDLDIKSIKQAVLNYYGFTLKDLEGKSRLKKIVTARQICVYLCKKLLSATYTNIGLELGKRDHSTIANAYTKSLERIEKEPLFKEAAEAIEHKILSP